MFKQLNRIPQTNRLLLGALGCLCLITSLTVYIGTNLLRQSVERDVIARVDTNMTVAWRLLHHLGKDIHLSDGKLFAGTTLLNNDSSFVDDVQATVGGFASVFQGDIRIATNVLREDGTRGLGTRLISEPVRAALLDGQHSFAGIVDVLGKRYYSRYDPVFDKSGQELGALYVGIEESEVLKDINRTRNIILGCYAASIVLVGLTLSWIGNRLAKKDAAQQYQLVTAHAHLDTALNNMANGLSLWDSSRRLVLANTRLCEILGLPPELIQPGITLREFIEARHREGNFSDPTAEEAYQRRIDNLLTGQPISQIDIGQSGLIINVQVRPLDKGGWIATYEDVTEQHRAEAQVKFMAGHDGLTGLANRTMFHRRLHELVKSGSRFTLLSLDLDRFKRVNDKLGHPVGDKLLVVVASRLSASVREDDLVARLGGDEFAILQVSSPDPADPAKLAERIIERLSEPFILDGDTLSIGASCGIASADVDGTDVELLIKQADIALYFAKAEGRGTHKRYDTSMQDILHQRQLIEADLSTALANGEFQVFYQPIVDAVSGEVNCFEALLRWQHPRRGRVSPADFIPVAEELGLISEIGAWVLQRGCLDAMMWPSHIKVAVNLSALQFSSGDLPAVIAAALHRSGLAARRLEVEITESVLLQDKATVCAVLHAIHSLGVRIVMDDFGTGYSSLAYLHSFPFDKIKIDRSFVREIASHAGSSAIVRAVIALAESLGMDTVVEGVETAAQLERVLAEGCGEIQGFLFSKPRPADQIPDVLNAVADLKWLFNSQISFIDKTQTIISRAAVG